jgi:hypothetical protein
MKKHISIQVGGRFNPYKIFNGIHIPDAMCSTHLISWPAKACWGMLKKCAGDDGFCYPKQADLVKGLGLSLSTIQRAIKELSDQKFIEIETPNGYQKLMHLNHKYFFLLHEILAEGLSVMPRQNDVSEGSQNDVSEGSQNDVSNIKGSCIKGSSFKSVSSKEETSKADALPSASNKTILHKRSNGKLLMNAKLKVDKPLKAKKPIKPYQPTEQALDLIEFWEGKGLKSISHNPETKTYWQSLIAFDKLLSGKAFNSTEYKSYEGKKFTLAEARKAISRFALMALNPDYEPRNVKFKSDLSKISPADFIFNAYVSSNGYGRSKFIHCHENEAKIIREKDVYVEDKYPNVTKAVMNKYKKDILGGSEIQFTNDDLNAFRKAANFAYELFAKNQNRLLGTYAQLKPYQIAESMFEALERGGADFAKVKPHWLCNGAMQKQLPAYLYQAAILQDRTCEGQQQVHYYDFGRPFSE